MTSATGGEFEGGHFEWFLMDPQEVVWSQWWGVNPGETLQAAYIFGMPFLRILIKQSVEWNVTRVFDHCSIQISLYLTTYIYLGFFSERLGDTS